MGLISWNLTAQISDFSTDIMLYSVSLAGAVDNPGVFLVPASTRVSEVLKLSETKYFTAQLELKKADKILEEDTDLFTRKYKDFIYDPLAITNLNGSKRNIILKRKNLEIQVDLQKFFVLGMDKYNPYIMDGDVIFVPSQKSEINLIGAVNKAGIYELVVNDRISDIIELALGCQENAYLPEVELVRFANSNTTEKIIINLENVLSNLESQDNILLQSGDRIYVRSIPEFHENKFVNVAGEVDFPGLYPIVEGKTTLLQILEQCGLNAENANLDKAFVQRVDLDIDFDPEFERLKLISTQNMTYTEFSYFKQKSRELRAKFSIDMEKLWETKDKKYNIILKNQDFIYIPQKSNTVFVSGQVENPGYLAIEAGQNYKYYIEKAGGFVKTARKNKIRIIRSDSGVWLKPSDELIIEDGDVIFVPEKSDYEFFQITKDILTILTQFATIILTIRTLTL